MDEAVAAVGAGVEPPQLEVDWVEVAEVGGKCEEHAISQRRVMQQEGRAVKGGAARTCLDLVSYPHHAACRDTALLDRAE